MKYGVQSADAAASCLLQLFSLKNWTAMSHLKVKCLANAVDCLMAVSGSSKSLPLFLLPVPPVILVLAEPEQRHDTCIEFTVRGYPHPKLRWFHEQKEILQNEYIRTEMDYYQDYLEGCLTFQNPTHINNGNYTLEASNSLGRVTKTVYGHFLMAPEGEGERKLLLASADSSPEYLRGMSVLLPKSAILASPIPPQSGPGPGGGTIISFYEKLIFLAGLGSCTLPGSIYSSVQGEC